MKPHDGIQFISGRFRFKQWHLVAFLAFFISILVFIISCVFIIEFPSIIESNIRGASILSTDTVLYDKWLNPEYHISTHISVYSVKNPDAILNNSIPSVKQTGPYVFDQKIRRQVHSMENGTVKFETFRSYYFNEDSSCPECFLHNRIWVPNIIYQKFVEVSSKPTMHAASTALAIQTPFLEVEVAELLFEGYADPFLDQVCTIPIVNFICESILNLPDRIGFFQKNGTSSGVFEVENGEADGGSSLGKIISWNGANTMPDNWWSFAASNKINGTDGNLFKPYITKDDVLTVFVPDLCRTLSLVFSEELEFKGIIGYKFIVPESEFDFTLEKNKGYCNPESKKIFFPEQNEKCLPNGLLDISRCQRGEPPVVVSLSNFLYAPEYVQTSIDGLRKPDPKLDQIEVLFEPRLGAVLEAQRRFQINVAMWRGTALKDLEHFRSSIVPVMHVYEHARIDDGNLEEIKAKLIYVEKTVEIAAFSAAICSILAVGVVVFYVVNRKSGSPVNNFIRKTIRKRNDIVSSTSNGVGKVGQSEC